MKRFPFSVTLFPDVFYELQKPEAGRWTQYVFQEEFGHCCHGVLLYEDRSPLMNSHNALLTAYLRIRDAGLNFFLKYVPLQGDSLNQRSVLNTVSPSFLQKTVWSSRISIPSFSAQFQRYRKHFMFFVFLFSQNGKYATWFTYQMYESELLRQ